MGDVDVRMLTIKQPWASAIAYGPKRVENRTWLPKYRGLLAIHAGLTVDQDWRTGTYGWHPMLDWMDTRPDVPLLAGSILAVCELVDAHAQSSLRCRCDAWASHVGGTTHIVLADVMPLPEPIPAKGGLGLRQLDPDVLTLLQDTIPRLGVTG